jgi:hypothetical protein
MALDVIDNILKGLQLADQRRFRQAELEQQKLDRDESSKRYSEEVKHRQAELKERQHQFDVTSKAAKALHDLTITQEKQKLSEGLLKGIPIPGATTQPAAPFTTSGIPSIENLNQANQVSQDYQLHTLPIQDSNGNPIQVTLPRPEVFAEQQANIQRKLNEPETEQKIEVARAAEAERLKRQQELDQSNFLRTLVTQQFEDKRNKERIEADNTRTKWNIASRERIAQLTKGQSGIDLDPYIQDAIDGNLTTEDIRRLPIPKPQQMQLIDSVTHTGARILSNEQRDLVKEFGQLTGAIKYMDEIIQNQGSVETSKIGGYLSGTLKTLDPNVTTPEEELKGRASVVSRFLKEKGNLSNQDINRVIGLFPSRFKPLITNIKKRNDYVKELDSLIESRLPNLTKEQRNIIKKRVGLLDVTELKSGQPTDKKLTTTPDLSKYYITPQ